MVTPYMGLILPVVGVTPRPIWANELLDAYSTIDSHNHTAGQGVTVPSAGIAINADLPFNTNNATALRSSRYINGSVLSDPADLTCVYASGGNLYYNNAIGQQVQITAGAGLNAASIGAIGGDYGTSTASVFYTSATSTFTFWQNTDIPAIMDMGDIVLHNTSSDTFGTTIKANPTLATNFNMVLPGALPASIKFVTIDNSGNMAFSYDVDNSTIEVASNLIQVKDLGVTTAKIADGAVTRAKMEPVGLLSASFAGVQALTASEVTVGSVVVNHTNTGRPVMFIMSSLVNPAGPPGMNVSISTTPAGSRTGSVTGFLFLNDGIGNIIARMPFTLNRVPDFSDGTTSLNFPIDFATVYTPGAGSFNYSLSCMYQTTGNPLAFSASIAYIKLSVYEL